MRQKWQGWNRSARKWLWVLVIAGMVGALPVVYDRLQTERTSKTVEFVLDYRGLRDAAGYRANPQDYMSEQLDRLKEAGVGSMAVYESNLDDFRRDRRLLVMNQEEVAKLTGTPVTPNANYTYVFFTQDAYYDSLAPLIERAFEQLDIPVQEAVYRNVAGMGRGLAIETPVEDALMKPVAPDPYTLEMLTAKGFAIVPRLVDSAPYDQEAVKELMAYYQSLGVKRILFEGESIKGYNDNENLNSLEAFAEQLNESGIGIAAIENMKQQQKGFNTLAYKLDYNVARLYSLSANDSSLKPEVISDRFALATKDRNIRMLYLNTSASRDAGKAKITDTVDNLITSLSGPEGAVARIEANGFTIGQATAFEVTDSPLQRYFKLAAVVGALALVTLLVSYFIPFMTIAAFILGLLGSAGLIAIGRVALFEQALALLAAISAPTVAVVMAIRKLSEQGPKPKGTKTSAHAAGGRSAKLPTLAVPSPRTRLWNALRLYGLTSMISLSAVPFVIALLNNVTYMLVLSQFRGVSLLHAAPIGLVALYVLLYRGDFVFSWVLRLLRTPITLAWVIVAAIAGAAGMYYLSRTGNSGSVSSIELVFRSFLENTIGVRPRNKEFLLAHPLFILGAFLALKYRSAAYIMIIAVIGQLSMVDTFAHIHSPVMLSLVRGILGLGLGLIIGIIAVMVWQIGERCWKRWAPLLSR